jgi:hypothetical protein
MDETVEKQRMLGVLAEFERAIKSSDHDLMESLFLREGPSGEDGATGSSDIVDIEPLAAGSNMRLCPAGIYLFTPSVGYSVCLRETVQKDRSETRQMSFLFLKIDDAWKILHAHFSPAEITNS